MTYEWVVMPFDLKNAGPVYRRTMNTIFHDDIGKFVEVYIDDVVDKSATRGEHLDHLRQAFKRMRKHDLKINPEKRGFGVSATKFLVFLAHKKGIEVDMNKTRAVLEAAPSTNKKELQYF